MIEILVEEGDITRLSVDAIVCPANSYGYMGGGCASVIKRQGGQLIELDAVSESPIPIGFAILTQAGTLKCNWVIHSPTMEQPAGLTNLDYIKKAVIAALVCADENSFSVIAMPGMGTGLGGIPKDKAAEIIVTAIANFEPEHLKKVILIDTNKVLVKEFEKLVNSN